MATYSPNGVNNNIGTMLGAGSDSNTLMNIESLIRSPGAKTYHAPSATGTVSGGTINYKRTADILSLEGYIDNVNGVSTRDIYPVNNTSTPERHSTQLGRKEIISTIDIHGNITYGTFNGSGYQMTATTGNVYDRPVDAANDPYGTPPRFYSLNGLSATTHSFTALTSY